MVSPGVYELGPQLGALRVKTGRSGAAAKAGHDLVLEATSWKATLTVGDSWSLDASVDAGSLVVVSGEGGLKPLTPGDCDDIKQNIARKVLNVDKFPTITFQTSQPGAAGNGSVNIGGTLSLVGASAPLWLDVKSGDDGTLTTAVSFDQSSFGIKPFSAMMGALKVADRVEIEISAKVG